MPIKNKLTSKGNKHPPAQNRLRGYQRLPNRGRLTKRGPGHLNPRPLLISPLVNNDYVLLVLAALRGQTLSWQ